MIGKGHREIARFTLQALDFAVGDELDVYVPADLDQFG
jgi:hypothetical protein